MLKRRLIALGVMVSMVGVPVVALARTEAPGGVRHTVEWHGVYKGCKATEGWAQRVWKHTGTGPGPEADPNYPGRVWDFRCKLPVTVTVTQTVGVPVPPATVTVTSTPTTTPTTTPPPDECDDDCDD